MKRHILFAWIAGLQALLGAVVETPSGSGSTIAGNDWPFLSIPGRSVRWQQVYGFSDFLNAIPEGGYITQVSFQVWGQANGLANIGAGSISNLQINFSTTQRGPGSLNPVFADNVGSDDQVVFGPGRLGYNGGVHGQFTFVVPLANPFLYDPRSGNLLMDVRNYSGAIWGDLYPPELSVRSGANVNAQCVVAGSVGALTGSMGGRGGLVTLLSITPVPEPGPLLFLTLAAVLFCGRALGRRRREQESYARKEGADGTA